MDKVGRFVQFAIVGFLAGVGIGEFLPMYWPLLCTSAAFFVCVLALTKQRMVKRVALALVCFCGGVLFLWARFSSVIPFQGFVESKAQVTSHVSVYDRLQVFQVKLDDGKKVTVRYSGETNIGQGDTLFVRGKAGIPAENKIASMYMSGSVAELKADRVLVLSRTCQNIFCSVNKMLGKTRSLVQTRLKQAVPNGYGSVADSLLFGGAGSVPADIKQTFRETGLSHILAVSGFNITIVLILLGVLRKYFDKKILLFIFICLCVYCVMSGLSSSVVRATIMGSVSLLGIGLKRLYLSVHALLVAAFCMAVYNPFVVTHDLSFQLSFLATLGILLFHDYFQVVFWFVPKALGIRSALCSTLCAVMLTLPLQIYVFSTMSLVVIPANLLTFALVPYFMLFSALSLIPVVGYGFGYVFSLCFSFVYKLLLLLSNMPHAFVHVTLPLPYVFLSYMAIFGLYIIMSRRLDGTKTV